MILLTMLVKSSSHIPNAWLNFLSAQFCIPTFICNVWSGVSILFSISHNSFFHNRFCRSFKDEELLNAVNSCCRNTLILKSKFKVAPKKIL